MKTKIDFKYFEMRLQRRLRELNDNLDQITNSLQELEERKFTESAEDWASQSDRLNIYKQLEQATRTEIEKILQAIYRINTRSFGTCTQCEGPIVKERLEVLPYTSICVECATG